jgi:hypothetical protein
MSLHLILPAAVRRHLAVPVFFALACSAAGSLIVYYPLDEASGKVANDAATADGAQNATATVAASDWQVSGGILGGAVRFSPTAQADVDEAFIYNTASTTTSLLAGPPFTLSVWIKTTDATAFTHAAMYLGDSTQSAMYYALGTSPANMPQLVARNTTAVNTIAPTAANDGQWHNLVAVFAGTSSRSLYVDGKVVATSATLVNNPVLNRLGIGALTRSNQTDAYGGILDEAGLFDTAQSAVQVALLNAFPRYDNVTLNDTDFDLALNVFNTQSGNVNTGAWRWSYATGLSGVLGTTGTNGSNPFVVLDNAGNGLAATPVPEPSGLTLGACGLVAGWLRRPRRREVA